MEVLCAPLHKLVQSDEARGNTAYSPLFRPLGSKQMHLNTSGKVEVTRKAR